MNKKELAAKASEKLGTKISADAVVAVFDVIAESLSAGEEVSVRGFGKFFVKNQTSRSVAEKEKSAMVKKAKFKAFNDLKIR